MNAPKREPAAGTRRVGAVLSTRRRHWQALPASRRAKSLEARTARPGRPMGSNVHREQPVAATAQAPAGRRSGAPPREVRKSSSRRAHLHHTSDAAPNPPCFYRQPLTLHGVQNPPRSPSPIRAPVPSS
jgi:hypothetical protein